MSKTPLFFESYYDYKSGMPFVLSQSESGQCYRSGGDNVGEVD